MRSIQCPYPFFLARHPIKAPLCGVFYWMSRVASDKPPGRSPRSSTKSPGGRSPVRRTGASMRSAAPAHPCAMRTWKRAARPRRPAAAGRRGGAHGYAPQSLQARHLLKKAAKTGFFIAPIILEIPEPVESTTQGGRSEKMNGGLNSIHNWQCLDIVMSHPAWR